jgi:hypothetical protein
MPEGGQRAAQAKEKPMPEYLIYFNQQWVGDHTEEWFLGRVEPSMAVVEEMKAAGVYVFAGGLEEDGPAYAADPTGDEAVVTDGPYVETKEHLGGFCVISVPDDETAKQWAAKVAVGCGWPQEVRRFGRPPS